MKGYLLNYLRAIFFFYKEGFANMRIGKTLWAIIAIKFFIFFVVMKLFFFNETLHTKFSTDEERSSHVFKNLIFKEE